MSLQYVTSDLPTERRLSWRAVKRQLRARAAATITDINEVATVQVEAIRKGGGILIKMGEDKQRRGRGGDERNAALHSLPDLRDLGFTRSRAARWKMIAKLPDERAATITDFGIADVNFIVMTKKIPAAGATRLRGDSETFADAKYPGSSRPSRR